MVLEVANADEKIKHADLVLTGEGRTDFLQIFSRTLGSQAVLVLLKGPQPWTRPYILFKVEILRKKEGKIWILENGYIEIIYSLILV